MSVSFCPRSFRTRVILTGVDAIVFLTYNNETWRTMAVSLAQSLSDSGVYKSVTLLHLEGVDLFGEDHLSELIRGDLMEASDRSNWTYKNLPLGNYGWQELKQNFVSNNLSELEQNTVRRQLQGEAGKSSGSMPLLESYAVSHFSIIKGNLHKLDEMLESRFSYATNLFIGNGKDLISQHLRIKLGRSFTDLNYFESFPAWSPKNSFFVGRNAAHDREGHQIDALAEREPNRVSMNSANLWLSERVSKSKGLKPKNKHIRKNIFFDTSEFEFQYLDDSWNVRPFKTQYEGFEYALNQFDPTGKDTTLRVHPNLARGSAQTQCWAVLEILKIKKRHPLLSVVWSFQRDDSYELMFRSRRVVFASSTIGLEALIAGKQVFRIGTSFFDILTGIQHLTENSPSAAPKPENAGLMLKYFRRGSFKTLVWRSAGKYKSHPFRLRYRPIEVFQSFWFARRNISRRVGFAASNLLAVFGELYLSFIRPD